MGRFTKVIVDGSSIEGTGEVIKEDKTLYINSDHDEIINWFISLLRNKTVLSSLDFIDEPNENDYSFEGEFYIRSVKGPEIVIEEK
ncbi:hypothetical protein [Alkalibacillus almallahensis]|uniref:hypothetical protein n=1 Tax=Alkalibacillus almallahensis TaxID=1379154 RepID=UPI0014232B4B|nr:hypothetical protein [Alkalibacillus almallahensis]NIK10910.1 hypothetical protein [Alkalibacillus almallahensis]